MQKAFTMTSNLATANPARIPEEVGGIQYNFCKNASCTQFGVPASQHKSRGGNTYNLTGGNKGAGNIPSLRCNACGEHFPLKSNAAIAHEIERISGYLNLAQLHVCCLDPQCTNFGVSVQTPKAYRVHGKSASGAKRYLCRCGKTVSVAKPTQWQRDTHHNTDIFKLLVNKMPLSRIVHVLGISWEVLYNRIDFIHSQCLAFAAHRESKLSEMSIPRLYLSVDRQEYAVNWSARKDKRNVILSAVASSCNHTGYVFGMHLNFDASVDKQAAERAAALAGDAALSPAFRSYARLWLDIDYAESVKKSHYKKAAGSLNQSISNTYDLMEQRADVESFDEKDKTHMLPQMGAQVHGQYTMIAHFHFLKQLLGNSVEKWRLFLDQDSGIRSACISAFVDEIKDKTMEAFYVRVQKGLTVDQKRQIKAQSQKVFDQFKKANPGVSDNDIKILMLCDEINKVQQIGNYKDRWVHHPLPDMSESNKAMCWLTEHNDFDLTHKAWLYNKASMHSVDNFFQKVRRRIAMLERPIHSSSTSGRTWNGYGAYNPDMVVKLLEIFRVVHNYIDVSKHTTQVAGVAQTTKSTPATRLGLAQAPLDYKDVLYFQP